MTKKVYLAAVFLLVTGISAKTQTLSIGPLAGVNLMTISDTNSPKILPGLMAGIFGNYSINEHFGINAKLMFSQMGTGTDISDDIVRLNYIQLPVSMVYFFGNNGNTIRPKIFAGLYGSYLLQARDNNGNDIVFPNGNDVYVKPDFGAQIGAGLNFIIRPRTWLNIDAGYSTGFNSIVDVEGTKNRNNGFQISAGVSFPLND
ncbi:MAG: PorT family protein [Saprospiraceae bacterium]|nr:PorT family protein [Saprospiraceae bacterium]